MKSFGRRALILFLNQTNEELRLETQSQRLHQGKWSLGKEPPSSILAGGGDLWQSESAGVGRGTSGSVTYRIVGGRSEQMVVVSWNVPFFGRNCYRGSVLPKEFDIEVQGGQGRHCIVVFIFRT
ncbi:hypothetical protein PMIN04_010939 [Paraphaeosphaeria minitans]|uniref:Uncharacterized protein n=1 Tax=Paraphaeosphaeria minitans TaxID=565426 RepID=A0A9P6KMF3_9PLEO|nr:hypothetical protein PMIN01_09831 [Paraphaeosphaeria minitans]